MSIRLSYTDEETIMKSNIIRCYNLDGTIMFTKVYSNHATAELIYILCKEWGYPVEYIHPRETWYHYEE